MRKKKRAKPRHLTLDDVDYEVSDGDSFIIDMDDFGDSFNLIVDKPKRRRKRKR